jgi:protein-L-isoaspartate(D-aspartate) O-methyltransferase
MTIDDCRHFYAEEVRIAAGLGSSATLAEAFARVPREKYMGPPPWRIASGELASMAYMGLKGGGYLATEEPRDLYHNVLVALDADRHLNNGQPSALARWLDALNLEPGDRVYHLGCGVGYYTAIIAEVVGTSGRVAASEVEPSLAGRARENLAVYPTVSVHSGDGAEFDPGVCDAIFINAGVTHPHPLWIKRLGENGRLVLPLTTSMPSANAGAGVMAKITRRGPGFAAEVVSFVGIYSCTSVRDPGMNVELGKAVASKALPKLKSVRTDRHEPSETCLAHSDGVCLSSAEPL